LIVEQTISAQMTTADANATSTVQQATLEANNARGIVGVFINVFSIFEPSTITVEEIAHILYDRIIETLAR
jgi:hypothetical protein